MGLELRLLERDALLGAVARQLGLADIDATAAGLPSELIAGVLRRIAVTTCPCPREVCVGVAVDAFSGLGETETIRQRVREVLDSLVVIGDLHELGSSTSLPGVVAEDWLYCAPPAYVVLDKSILLLGIEAEDQATLPVLLRSRVVHQRELRYIQADGGESTQRQLHAAGYLEVSEVSWTRLPRTQPCDEFIDAVVRRLNEVDHRGELDGFRVYGGGDGSRNYASRLGPPAGCSGYYVGRRPQAFGAPIWVFVELEEGRPVRFMDLPWRGGKFRGCDHGWRTTSALDARAGRPQIYRVTADEGENKRFEFFSPLPIWIERRLRLLGEKVRVGGTLFSYVVDQRHSSYIDELVQSYMWFKRT